jgi:hypothetical protein
MVVLFDRLPILTRLRACPETASFPASSRPSTDAGLRPALWNDVVVRINEFAGGRACGLYSKDSISKFGVTHYYCGITAAPTLATFTSIRIPIPDSIR